MLVSLSTLVSASGAANCRRVRYHRRVVKCLSLLLCASLVAACGEKKPQTPPTPDPGTPAGTEKVNGTERIGWDQQAGSTEELATFRYLIYVDANATEAQEASCTTTPGPTGYACSAKLPPMSAGQHALSVSSYVISSGARLESPRSVSLPVFLVAQSTSITTAGSFTITTNDGVHVEGSVVAEGLLEPTDLAPAPDGRIFIAERGGRVRVFRDGAVQAGRAITLPDATTKDGQGLLALAIDPQYERNHFLYAVYTTATGFRLVRLRAVGDTLGDRAVLMDRIPNSALQPAAAMRFGPDGKLYVGFDDAGEPRRAGDLGSLNGKILRLNADATTPRDQPGASPVFVANVGAPRGMDWDARGEALWIADGRADGLLNATARPQAPAVRYKLPDGSAATALTLYRSDRIRQFQGNLLVATSGGHALLRVRLDPGDPAKILSAEQMLGDAVEPARAVAVGGDGAIYIATKNALLRLLPSSPP